MEAVSCQLFLLIVPYLPVLLKKSFKTLGLLSMTTARLHKQALAKHHLQLKWSILGAST
jgi:hypothetical protein